MEMIRINYCNNNVIKQLGMTLVELLISVAIIGVLATIAYPNYQQYILKSYRSAAIADLLRIQLELEHNRTQQGFYDFQSVINYGNCVTWLNCQTEPQRYQFSIISGSIGINLYQIIATPQAGLGQNKDKCGTLALNAGGVGTAIKQGKKVTGCWN